jgi:hypothetical protein
MDPLYFPGLAQMAQSVAQLTRNAFRAFAACCTLSQNVAVG